MNRRKRRDSNPHLQNPVRPSSRVPVLDFRSGLSSHPCWPSPHEATGSPRYRARARRLTPEQEATIHALAGTRSLRSLAAEFGVSHETIRAVIRKQIVKLTP
jgi:hypothetical protein